MDNIYNAIQNLYNMDKTTWQEVLAELYNLVANVENKFDLFEIKFGSLLGEQVTRELKKMYDNGSLASLINDVLLQDINEKVDTFKTEVNEQLDTIKKNHLILNIKDFGAIGDGVANDTQAIQKAIDYAETLLSQNGITSSVPEGVKLRCPSGKYKIDGIVISQGITFEGDGKSNTYFLITSATNRVGLKLQSNGIIVKDFTVKSLGDVNDGNNTTGVQFYRDDGGGICNTIVSYVNVEGFSNVGIDVTRPVHVIVEYCVLTSNKIGILGCRHPISKTVGTTLKIEHIYIMSAKETGIKLYYCQQSMLTDVVIENCQDGLYMEKSNYTILNGVYFEAIGVNDIHTYDSRFINLGTIRSEKGENREWSYVGNQNYAEIMVDTQIKEFGIETREFTQVLDNTKEKKKIKPYKIINIENSERKHGFDGMLYDDYRSIPIITANNLLKPDLWDNGVVFDPNVRAIRWVKTGSGSHCTKQKVTLSTGVYEMLYFTKTYTNGEIRNIRVLDSSESEIKLFQVDPSFKYNYAQERYNIMSFTIETEGVYYIQFEVIPISNKIDIGFTPMLYKRSGDPYLVSNYKTDNSFDQSMYNSMRLAFALASISDSYNLLGSGKKETYGSTAPTTGTWNVGDRQYNIKPTAGGYMGWVCVSSGDFSATPPTFKGFGLIES